MALENADLNREIVEHLSLRSGDRVLEVGCGPGVGLAAASAQVGTGVVAGVDPSSVMVAQARRRNRVALREGRVEIAIAGAERLPFASGSFSCAFSVNTVRHWRSVEQGLGELHRVLESEGRLTLAMREQRPDAGRDPHARGASEEELNRLTDLLFELGFEAVALGRRERSRETIALLEATRAGETPGWRRPGAGARLHAV
jgi:ubiquinone/menaquinone biosynthesis C-methylase UbiE